jgi:hypothetical protein
VREARVPHVGGRAPRILLHGTNRRTLSELTPGGAGRTCWGQVEAAGLTPRKVASTRSRHTRGASTSILSTHVSGCWWPTPVCHGPSRTTTSSSPFRGMQRHSPPGGSADELPPPNWKKSACRRPSFVPSTWGQSSRRVALVGRHDLPPGERRRADEVVSIRHEGIVAMTLREQANGGFESDRRLLERRARRHPRVPYTRPR